MKNNMQEIVKILMSGTSIFLIGKSNSGKSYYIKNKLMPFLEKSGIKIKFYENCDNINNFEDVDVCIFDEVELLFDKKFLEKKHPEENPYYSGGYLKKVSEWFLQLGKINKPSIYIVTRNADDEIEYIKNNMRSCEWNDNKNIEIIQFE